MFNRFGQKMIDRMDTTYFSVKYVASICMTPILLLMAYAIFFCTDMNTRDFGHGLGPSFVDVLLIVFCIA